MRTACEFGVREDEKAREQEKRDGQRMFKREIVLCTRCKLLSASTTCWTRFDIAARPACVQ
jgi:hypothetical protein